MMRLSVAQNNLICEVDGQIRVKQQVCSGFNFNINCFKLLMPQNVLTY